MLRVLDIGTGSDPWYAKQIYFNRLSRTPSRLSLFTDALIRSRHLYCALDSWEEVLFRQRETMRASNLPKGTLVYVRANGLMMPFAPGTFHAAVISDVLCLPPEPYCSCESCDRGVDPAEAARLQLPPCKGDMQPGMSDLQKKLLITETLRVLEPKGMLIISVYQTRHHATAALKRISNKVNSKSLVLLDTVRRGKESDLPDDGFELVLQKTR